MEGSEKIWVIVPAFNEASSLPLVLEALPRLAGLAVIVADNGSDDGTGDVALAHGAIVVREDRRGYGQACLTAMDEVQTRADARDLVVFLDADFSDDPRELPALLAPLQRDTADLVVGSRVLGRRERGALLPHARWGNWLAGHLIHWMTGVLFTDLGPFRALRWGSLQALGMRDRAFGWTVEMQLKAASRGLRCVEVPVSYRRRVGTSKITGTLRGTVMASLTILGILGRWALPGHGGLD
jgi:glycosyltransferase involved in cell wall biosynthesis